MPYRKTKILMIDDEESILLTAAQTLQIAGYDVVTARNGEDGLIAARANAIRLVILDVMMPGKSGFDVLRELHADPATSAIPVVMMTALRSPEDERTARLAGAKDILVKPVERKDLVAMVKQYAGPSVEKE